MIDLRYHVYSLVAVFVALAVGVLIGIGIAGGPSGQAKAIDRQRQAIQDLRDRFRHYSEQLGKKQAFVEDLTDDLRDADTLVGGILPALVEGILAGRNVAVIQMGPGGDVARLQKTVVAAGGTVTSVTRVNTDFNFDDAGKMADVAKALPQGFRQADTAPHEQVWGFLAQALAFGWEAREGLEALERSGLLETSGDYASESKLVVILSPAGPDMARVVAQVGSPLLAKLRNHKFTVVVASPAPADDDAAASPWLALDVPTVSHSDYAMGQICVVESLIRGEGHYGLGPQQTVLPNRLLRK